MSEGEQYEPVVTRTPEGLAEQQAAEQEERNRLEAERIAAEAGESDADRLGRESQ
jgi:hypothetical protein